MVLPFASGWLDAATRRTTAAKSPGAPERQSREVVFRSGVADVAEDRAVRATAFGTRRVLSGLAGLRGCRKGPAVFGGRRWWRAGRGNAQEMVAFTSSTTFFSTTGIP